MKKVVGSIISGVIIFAVVIMLFMCAVKVPAGYVGVQYKMNGGVIDKTLNQGWHIVSPTVDVNLYSVGIEQSYLTADDRGDSPDDESFSASSSEGKSIQVEMTYTYRFDPEHVSDVFVTFKGQNGKEVLNSFIKPNIISWTKEVVAHYKVSDILGERRAEINTALTEYLAEKFAPYHILISNVSLVNLEVDEETRQAISNKITAQQNAETQAINNQTAIDKAKAEAEAQLERARAEAEAQLIEAEAEAEANRKIAESLTDEVLKAKLYEAWDGVLPQVSGSNSLIEIPLE